MSTWMMERTGPAVLTRGRGLEALGLPLASPLVDGLLGEDPLPLHLQARNAPFRRHAAQRFGVHGEVGGRLGDRHLVLGKHVWLSSSRVSLPASRRPCATSALPPRGGESGPAAARWPWQWGPVGLSGSGQSPPG